MRKTKIFLLMILISLSLVSCLGNRADLGEPFTLAEGETVKIRGESISLRLVAVGRDYTEDGEDVFAELEVKHEGDWKTIWLYFGEDWQVGDYVISMESANPFGDVSCELIVEKQ